MAFNGKSAACAPLTANKAAADPIIIAFVVVVILISKPAPIASTRSGLRIQRDPTSHQRCRDQASSGKHKPLSRTVAARFSGDVLHNGNGG
ncbi:MAG: hypothetical protein J0H51_19840, partial [Rhizobiales bacterium]|nr:hypothetical protein [Hyphomicrobiales bacterium]